MSILSYFYKTFSRILYVISLIITVEIIIFGKTTFMEYAEFLLPYILLLSIVQQSALLFLKKDKLYFRISEIALFLFVLCHKLLTADLRIFILAVFLLYLTLSIKYREPLNTKVKSSVSSVQ